MLVACAADGHAAHDAVTSEMLLGPETSGARVALSFVAVLLRCLFLFAQGSVTRAQTGGGATTWRVDASVPVATALTAGCWAVCTVPVSCLGDGVLLESDSLLLSVELSLLLLLLLLLSYPASLSASVMEAAPVDAVAGVITVETAIGVTASGVALLDGVAADCAAAGNGGTAGAEEAAAGVATTVSMAVT